MSIDEVVGYFSKMIKMTPTMSEEARAIVGAPIEEFARAKSVLLPRNPNPKFQWHAPPNQFLPY